MKKLSRVRGVIALAALVVALSACTNEELIRTAFADHGATPAQQDQAVEVARCESGLNATAVSPGGGNWGLFQINRIHAGWIADDFGYPWHYMQYPWQNAQAAARLWSTQGWQPWTCARSLGY